MCITERKPLISSLDETDEAVDFFVEFRIVVAHLLDLADAVDDGRVVFSTEFLADFRKRGFVSSLARYMATWRGKAILGELFLDFSWDGLILNLWQMSFWIFSTVTRRADESSRSFRASLVRSRSMLLALEGGKGDDPAQVALELPDIGLDLVGDEQGDGLGKDDALRSRLFS